MNGDEMIYREIKDEIHLMLTFAILMTLFGTMVSSELGVELSYQKFIAIILGILGIIFSHIAHIKWLKNPKTYYPTSMIRFVCWVNFAFMIYLLFY